MLLTSMEEDRVQNMETDIQLTTQHRLHLLQNIQQFTQVAANQREGGQSPEYGD